MIFNEEIENIKSDLGLHCDIKFIKGDKGYYITKNNDDYQVVFGTKSDAFRAMLVIKCGLTEKNSNAFNRFEELGFMVDLSRNAVLNMATMKKLIRLLATLGYNQLFLYMEDTYEVKGQPYFGHFRGRYSEQELREIDDYANRYGIEAIPCIQTLAHLGSALKWPVYSDIIDIDDILLADNEKTYSFITDMISSLRNCFKTNKIHIGMDEAYHVGRGEYLNKNGYKDSFYVMNSHINNVKKICEGFDFLPMIWSDVFFNFAFGGYEAGKKFNKDVLEKIPNDIEIVYWDYYHTDSKIYDDMIECHRMITDNIRFAGGAWKWSGFAPNGRHAMKTSECAIKSLIKNSVKKVFVTAWADNGAESSIFSCLPAVVYYAQAGYNGYIKKDDTDFKSMFKSIADCAFDDYMMLDAPNEPTGIEEEMKPINPNKYLLYDDVFMGLFNNRVKRGYNNMYKLYAEKLHKIAKENSKFGYVFENEAKLCDVLAIKSELGLDIDYHYKNRNKDGLLDDAEKILKVIEKLNLFYKDFSERWYYENKMYGMEVHDIRFGGLLKRLEVCHNLLIGFINGKIDNIEVLEENKLGYEYLNDKDVDEPEVYYNIWSDIVTANKISI